VLTFAKFFIDFYKILFACQFAEKSEQLKIRLKANKKELSGGNYEDFHRLTLKSKCFIW
jgi:hypothetical protein